MAANAAGVAGTLGGHGSGAGQSVGRAALHGASGVGLATSGLIGGLVSRGLQGTVEGAMLADSFTLLSREIAGTFLPVVRQMTAHLQLATRWFQGLTGQEQNHVMKVGMGVGALGGVAALAPVLGPFTSLLSAGLAPVFGSLVAATGPLIPILGAVAVGVGLLAAVSEPVRESLGQLWEQMKAAWAATQPLREVLFQIAESTVANLFKLLASAMENLAPVLQAVIGLLTEGIQKLKGMVEQGGNWLGRRIAANFDGIALNAEAVRGDALERQRQEGLRRMGMNPGAWNNPARALNDAVNNNRPLDPGRQVMNPVNPAGGAGPNRVTLLGQGAESADASVQRIQDALNRQDTATEDPMLAQQLRANGLLELILEAARGGRPAGPPPNGGR